MTSFSRYYCENVLVDISMDNINDLITDSKNKDKIAEYVYQRLYTRFLKIFDFECGRRKTYSKEGKEENLNEFKEEYKNGFIITASCSLLIETFASYLTGSNVTSRPNSNAFKKVFDYAEEKNNPLQEFKNTRFYENIRCGLLHQGETYGNFKIRRKGNKLIDKEEKIINAQILFISLKKLLILYKEDLSKSEWDSQLWDTCRLKIRHIINNSK